MYIDRSILPTNYAQNDPQNGRKKGVKFQRLSIQCNLDSIKL